jgi:cytoskeletal protein RodZ
MAVRGHADSMNDLFIIHDADAEATNSATVAVESHNDSVPPKNSKSHGKSPAEALTAAQLGARLKDARKRQGLSVGDVAKVLNFQNKIVRSIESGDLAQLPTSYEIGFFRTYAQFVGEPALGMPVCEAVSAIREGYETPLNNGLHGLTDNLMPVNQTNWFFRIAMGAVLIVGAVAWLAWPEGRADQRTTMGESEIPIQYTFDVRDID